MINVLLPTAASPQKTTLNIRLKRNRQKLDELSTLIIYSNGKSFCILDVVDVTSCGIFGDWPSRFIVRR
jgi:hypothetical protein